MLTKDSLFILFIICVFCFVALSIVEIFLYFKFNIPYIWKLIRRKKKEKMLFVGMCILAGMLSGCIKYESYMISKSWADRPVFYDNIKNEEDMENSEETEEEEVIDLEAPSITVKGYDAGATYNLNNKNMKLSALIEDDISGLSTNVYLRDNGRVYYPVVEDDVYVFNINTDYREGEVVLNEISIIAYDNAGNKNEYVFYVNIDITTPELEISIDEDCYIEDNTVYINRQETDIGSEKEFSFDVNIKDNYELKGLKIDMDGTILTDSLIYEQFYDENYKVSIPTNEMALTLVVTDVFGNMTKRKFMIIKDKKPPIVDIIVDKVDIKDVFNNSSLSFVEKFKAYFTKSSLVKIVCTAIEDDASGIKEVWFFYEEDKEYKDIRAEKTANGYEAVISIPNNTKRQIYCAAMDNLLNVNSNNDKYLDIFCNSSVPLIGVKLTGNHKIIDDRIFYKGDLTAKIDISDDLALERYEISLDGMLLVSEDEMFASEGEENLFVKERVCNLDLGGYLKDKDYCVLEIRAQNYGENQSSQRYELIKDEMAPVITNVFLNNVPMKDTRDYEYFYSDTLNVFFDVVDITNDKDMTGDENILLHCIAENENEQKELIPERMNESTYRLMLQASFKGQVIIKATDSLGNTSSVMSAPVIIESWEDFLKNTELKVYHDGKDIYSDDTYVYVEARNDFCGIKEVEYSISGAYDIANNKEKVIVNPGADKDFWVKSFDKNIYTVINGQVLVQNDCNDISITVAIKDNVGHTLEKSVTISIDKTSPGIELVFPGMELRDYNNQNVLVDVSVFERNFSKDKLIVNVEGPNKEKVIISAVSYQKDSQNPNNDTHSFSLSFEEDGEYSFFIECEDEAKNKTTSKTYSFVVDKTAPQVRIEYDKDFVNEKYINAPLSVTIVVDEVNFDEKGVTIDGLDTILPDNRKWEKDEEGYKYILLYDSEGEYEFSVTAVDLAGNQSESIDSKRFIVDLTKPDIKISGVENGSANNGKVSPVVIFSDENIDEESALALFIKSNGEILPNEEKKTIIDNSIVFSYEDIKKEKQYDDLYSLEVRVLDLAGNESKERIAFSVNRFGSVYTLSENTGKLLNKFTKDEVNIKIIETNTDILEEERIRATLMENGCVNTLEENKDYYINKVYGDFKHQYEYVFNKDLFKNDGSYVLSLYSKDLAGNTNESLKKDKEAEVIFGVDRTKPLAFGINFDEGDIIDSYSFRGGLCIKDNMELENVEILVNDKIVKSEIYDDNYFFSIPTDNKKQTVKINAKDKAGNVINKELGEIMVVSSHKKSNTKGLYILIIVAIIFMVQIGRLIVKKSKWKEF